MSVLVLGLAIFLGMHLMPTLGQTRARLRDRLGNGGYRGLFSSVSLIGLVLIIYGYGLARQDPVIVWDPPRAMRHVTALLMLPVFILRVAADVPGKIKEKLRHPMLAGVMLWAVAHLLANAMLADIVLFGGFLVWAIYDRVSVARREQAGLVTVSGGPVRNDVIAVIAGLALYVIFAVWAHAWLIGVAPFA